MALADLGGVPGSRVFRFDIKNFQNVTASGVGAPLRGRRPHVREILDPPLNGHASVAISIPLNGHVI